MRVRLASILLLALCGCAADRGARSPAPPPADVAPLPAERPFFDDLRRLTFGGENAEAYWSFDGRELSLQARHAGEGCDRIYRMRVDDVPPRPALVSSGLGATTCAHFLPGGDILYASTHLAGRDCPSRPDMRHGYTWALYAGYDIFLAAADRDAPRRLTDTPGYDAEGTVCGVDGSILFTSVRDGDLELYRMNRDGGDVKRLTHAEGYDGGAFFNHDCSKIVWRAGRPRNDREREDYRSLLARGLVRPSKLEIWIADADGGNPMQLTYLDAASFAPSFHPSGKFILFSSNAGDPRGREFDIWIIRPDGSGLRRVTASPGFDGFPHFSPDGKWLAFSSNRATPPGSTDTDIYLARWIGSADDPSPETAADRVARDIAWLADPAREGRGLGTAGLVAAGEHLERRLRDLGVAPAGADGGYRHVFEVSTSAEVGPESFVRVAGRAVPRDAFTIAGFSAAGDARGPLVLAGHGVVDEKLKIDDYAGKTVKGKVVLVRRFVPDGAPFEEQAAKARHGDLRRKAYLARERGARALVVVDWPAPPPSRPDGWKAPDEAPLPPPQPEGAGDAGIPVVLLRRSALEPHLPALERGRGVTIDLRTALVAQKTSAFNVLGRIAAGKPAHGGPPTIIVGAHYDHLGLGGRASLAPDRQEPHLGADDNASGTAAVLEIARTLMARREDLGRDVIVAFFSAEESGLLGSTHLLRDRPELARDAIAMINLDMVGRLRGNRLDVLGSETAPEWAGLIASACAEARVECAASGSGFGASDQAAFYAAGLPVLHLFSGTHADYHKPSDTAARVNAAGTAAVADAATRLLVAVAATPKLSYKRGIEEQPRGDVRSFNASLGTIPDYAGPPDGSPGVLLSGVRPGGAAELAGMRRGDVLVRLGRREIRGVPDLGFALNEFKPGESVTAIIRRDGQELPLPVTFQEARRPR